MFESLCCIWQKPLIQCLKKSGANEISAPNLPTPVTLSMSSLHKNAALGSGTSKTLTQLITIINPSWEAFYKYRVAQIYRGYCTALIGYNRLADKSVFVRWGFCRDHRTAYNHHGHHYNNHHHQYSFRDRHYSAGLYVPQQQQPFICIWPQWQEAVYR